MKTPWNKSIETLHEELAERLSAYATAQQATADAEKEFDAEGSAATEKAWRKAEDDEKSAAAHLGRAARLLKAAEEQQKAETRAKLEREALAIEAELAAPDSEEDRLVAAEVAAYAAAAKARVARRDRNIGLVQKAQRLQNIRGELGFESRTLLNHQIEVEPPHFRVSERLQALAAGVPTSEPISHYLHVLARVQF